MQIHVFAVILTRMFPTPCVFAVVQARFGLAVAQWIAAWTADFFETKLKTQGFGNMRNKIFVKTPGSASGRRQDPVFFHAEKNARNIFWVHLPSRGASWGPAQLGQQVVLFIQSLY